MNALRRLPWLTIALCVLAMAWSWMSPEISAPNERTRVYLAHSLASDGDLVVSPEVQRWGKPFDISERDGAFYSDKAPGAALLAVPSVALARALDRADSIEALTEWVRRTVMLPAAAASLALLASILLALGVAPATTRIAIPALALATPFFHYGAAFFGHALVTLATLATVAAALHVHRDDRPHPGWLLATGAAAGAIVLVEYQGAILCVLLLGAWLVDPRNRRPLPLILPLIGALPAFALVGAYNHIAFGGVLQTSYDHLHHATFAAVHAQGLVGIRLPTPASLFGLLFTPSRGLVATAPFLLLAVIGVAATARSNRVVATWCAAGTLVWFLLIAGFGAWDGGWGHGPRMLVPAFGLAVIPAAIWLDQQPDHSAGRAVALGLILWGAFANVFVSSAFPEIPAEVANPLRSVAWPLHRDGTPSPSIGELAGLAPKYSAILLGALAILALAPTFRAAARLRARLLALVLTVALAALYVTQWPERNPTRDTRAFIEWVATLRRTPN